jgi:hypothetical protein
MLRFLVPAFLLSLALVQPAAAQDQIDSAGLVPDHGNGNALASAAMIARMNAPETVKENCWRLGCVLITNETSGYDVVGFYVDTGRPGKSVHWSDNQFETPLLPSKVTLRFKTGGANACALPLRIVLRNRDTKEKSEIAGTASLCATPHEDTLIRIKVLEGKVYVRGDDEAPVAAETH